MLSRSPMPSFQPTCDAPPSSAARRCASCSDSASASLGSIVIWTARAGSTHLEYCRLRARVAGSWRGAGPRGVPALLSGDQTAAVMDLVRPGKTGDRSWESAARATNRGTAEWRVQLRSDGDRAKVQHSRSRSSFVGSPQSRLGAAKTEVAVKGSDKPKKLDKKKAQKTLKEKRAEKKAKKSF